MLYRIWFIVSSHLRCARQLAKVVRSGLEEIVRAEQVGNVINAENVKRLHNDMAMFDEPLV